MVSWPDHEWRCSARSGQAVAPAPRTAHVSAPFGLHQAGAGGREHGGQRDGLDKPTAVAIADGDVAAAADDDFPRDGKAQAGAGDLLAPAGIDAEERLEHLLDQVRRDAGATV